jgi:hypothetical protein
MAEGGGTVGYLAKPNPNGVSVHFVVEYSGRVVQMLRLDHMHSSIRTSDIRTSDDIDGFYGRSHAVAVMGPWADVKTKLGPNHASIAVEVEGFAVVGPNAAQSIAIDALAAELALPAHLGHRDFADYKACPGGQFPWGLIGGHGEEETMRLTLPPKPTLVTIRAGAILHIDSGLGHSAENVQAPTPAISTPLIGNVDPQVERLVSYNGKAYWMAWADATAFAVAPPPDCTAAVKAATDPLKAERDDAVKLLANYTDRLVKVHALSNV